MPFQSLRTSTVVVVHSGNRTYLIGLAVGVCSFSAHVGVREVDTIRYLPPAVNLPHAKQRALWHPCMEDQSMPSTVQPLNDDESPLHGDTSNTKLKEEPDLVKVNGDAHAEEENNMGQELPPSPSDNGDAFQCKLCTFIAPSAEILEEHRNVHMGRKPFKCEECGFASAYQNALLQHMQLHRENIQKGPDSPSEEEMDDHSSTNGNDSLIAQENMQSMLEGVDQDGVARGDRQPSVYQCKLCTYIAPTKTHLNEHMNVHSGNKPYKCLVCGFSSSFRSSLMRHLIVHTGTAKMFKCDRCLYQTPYKCNLVTHRKKKHPEAMYNVDFGSFLTQDEINRENSTTKMTSPTKNMDINSMYNPSLTTVFPGTVLTNSVGINRMGNVSPIIDNKYQQAAIDSTAQHHMVHNTFNHSGSSSVPLPNSGATPNSTSNSYTQDLPMADEGSRTSPGSADGYLPHHASRTIGGSASHSESTSGNNNGTGLNEQAVAIDFSNSAQLSAEESSAASDNSGPVVSDVQSLTSSPGGITSPIMSPSDNIPPNTTSATSPSTVNEISVITPLQLQQKTYEEMLEKPFGAKKRKRKPTPLPVPFGKRYTMEINREREAALARKAYEEGLTGRSEGDVPYLSSRPMKSRILSGNAFITSTSGNINHTENSLNQAASDITNTSSYSLAKASDYHLGSDESHYNYRLHHEKGPHANQMRKRNVETQTIPGDNDTDENLASKGNIQTCPYCGTMFPEQVIFSLHMSCHGTEHPFQCSICQYVCRDKIEFTCHITRSQHTR
ncbi:ikaros family zinc finger protein-like isoform X2 [Anneissia japonica]|uniref:ikaros family zinc finger protein-like isoform X2 n=1 Tax=Anneissia japonica TaxID=1529436 RepID=UPI0014257E9D|nr:ikaros family zinc finger protein-like isoform X2 [Anneissia japonica]